MSYYDFDNHFWHPREVCGIATKTEAKKRFLEVLLRSLHQMLHTP
jgi:hypothetical protein